MPMDLDAQLPSQDTPTSQHLPAVAIGPKGIGGWLLIPIAGFVIAMYSHVYNLWQYDMDGLKALFNSHDATFARLKTPIIISTINTILSFIFSTLCLFLIFRKSFRAPAFAILTYIFFCYGAIFEYWFGTLVAEIDGAPMDTQLSNAVGQTIVSTIIWSGYFIMSKRVENTFTEWSNDLF